MVGRGCDKVFKVGTLQRLVVRLYNKSLAVDVCVNFRIVKAIARSSCFMLAYFLLTSLIDLRANKTGSFSCKMTSPNVLSEASTCMETDLCLSQYVSLV